jgi:hypothetical protein
MNVRWATEGHACFGCALASLRADECVRRYAISGSGLVARRFEFAIL